MAKISFLLFTVFTYHRRTPRMCVPKAKSVIPRWSCCALSPLLGERGIDQYPQKPEQISKRPPSGPAAVA